MRDRGPVQFAVEPLDGASRAAAKTEHILRSATTIGNLVVSCRHLALQAAQKSIGIVRK